ncbi:MAG: lysine biosynthesis protein LysX [Aigarchaeota archaeon]|nr:lysine biosynthesis protein LysX [Aigarchaeota archaeon]MCX8192483.1 lysine biosynthesis protein LysX [Nitrososphaeria archaeon]MDW7985781.1 lysine biosynthesis protein LysX [Nitrososphaerota archaeon]
MKIGIVYDLIRWEERALIDAVKKLGHDLVPIQVNRKVFWLTEPNGFSELDFAIQRCVSFYRALASTAILEEQGVTVVNSFNIIRDCEDKLYTTLKLSRNKIPVPKTAVSFNRETCLNIAEKLGYPLIVKPIFGSWGRMVSRALDKDSLLEILDFREYMQSPYFKVHYLQEYIDKPSRDIRAFYFWEEVPAAIYRVSNSWKTNTALGGVAVEAELSNELIELVKRSGDVMGGGILGIDILESKDGRYFISEVNAIPEFRNTVRVTGKDLARLMIELTIKNIKQ